MKVARRAFRVLVLLTLSLSTTWQASGRVEQTAAAQKPAAVSERLDAHLAALAGKQLFSGTVLVARDGHIVLSKGYGMANYEWDIPNAPSTKFRLGSITKQFTAMAILQLEERGLLSITDPITKYLADYPRVGDTVTIHHLLTHSSGIPSYTGMPDYGPNMRVAASITQMIDRFKDKPLEFAPGSQFKYDNSGYFLLGAIIEKVSGKAYDAAILFQ